MPIVYSGDYEVNRLRRRRDQRVQEYIRHRSRRFYHPPPPVTMCRIIKLLIYFIVFLTILAVVTGAMVYLVYHFRIPRDKPAVTKMPGLCTVPGTYVGDEKHIVWGGNFIKEIAAIRREMDRHVDQFGIVGQKRFRKCNKDLFWGYATGKPCILLKLTQSLGFKPEPYASALELPDDVPEHIFNHVIAHPADEAINRIWAACTVTDKVDLKIKVNYIPHRNFVIKDLFKPHRNSTKNEELGDEDDPSMNRFIGVQFRNIPPNRDINIHCQVWAKNIPLDVVSVKFKMRFIAPNQKIDIREIEEREE
ncbi:hypothetical protein KR054_009924, partial [Drosophila jambulina]